MKIVSYIPDQLLIHSNEFSLDLVEFSLAPTLFTNKPQSALWTSSARKSSSGILTSAWLDWCQREEFVITDHTNKYLVTPTTSVCICEIDNVDDMKDLPLCQSYTTLDETEEGSIYLEHMIDFKTLSTMVDGLHYTGLTSVLSCWDCESTVWFNTNWIQSITKVD